jgi:hypothetical protein
MDCLTFSYGEWFVSNGLPLGSDSSLEIAVEIGVSVGKVNSLKEFTLSSVVWGVGIFSHCKSPVEAFTATTGRFGIRV